MGRLIPFHRQPIDSIVDETKTRKALLRDEYEYFYHGKGVGSYPISKGLKVGDIAISWLYDGTDKLLEQLINLCVIDAYKVATLFNPKLVMQAIWEAISL